MATGDPLFQRYRPKNPQSSEVTMVADDTEYSWVIPANTREFQLIMKDPTTGTPDNKWRYSAATGEVASATGGTPVAIGGAQVFNNGLYGEPTHAGGGEVFFAHTAGTTQTMRVDFV